MSNVPDFRTNVIETLTLTLDNSDTTDSVYIGGTIVAGILIPASLTSTTLTLQMSLDDATFYDVSDPDGTNNSLTATSSAEYFSLEPRITSGLPYIRLVGDQTETGTFLFSVLLTI